MSNEEFKNLILSYLLNDITESEKVSLFNMVASDPENEQLFNHTVAMWQSAGTLSKSSDESNQLAFQKLLHRMQWSESNLPDQQSKKIFGRGKYKILNLLKVAAIILFAITIGGLTTHFIFTGQPQLHANPKIFQIVTPNGTRSELSLSDGTKVWLNAGSTLTYTEDYNIRTRAVNLTGEAYFQVAKDQQRPFVVHSAGMQIRALGTSFNVKAYPEEKMLTATLVEGKIVVEGKSIKQENFCYTLLPKQNIIVTTSASGSPDITKGNTGIAPDNAKRKEIRQIEKVTMDSNVNTLLFTSWKDSRWVIKHVSFHELAEMLQRRYNVRINYKATEMDSIFFTGTIENETLEQVIHVLGLTAPLRYEFGKGEVTLGIDKNQQDRFQNAMTKIP
jgi:ferric-dicitrate binding protein FerR (iron transport regulator)